MASLENLALKDEARLVETQKVCQRDRERIEDLQEKLAEERNAELIVRQLAGDRKSRLDWARRVVEQMAIDGGAEKAGQAVNGDCGGSQETTAEQISSVSVVDRLRSNSLSLVAKIILSSEDPDISTEEQKPVYLGERLDGKRHGFGILQYPAGAEYMGEFKDDLPSGIGIERYADGTTYEGSFLNGERHGMGVYTISSNVAYLGMFRGGRRAGPGVIAIPTRSASVPYWPVVVCLCRADSFEAYSAAKFRTDCLQNALLIADVGLAQQSALESAKRARSVVLTDFFSGQEQLQIDSRHHLGLSVVPKNPSLQAFRGSSSFFEARPTVVAKMHDVKTVSRLAGEAYYLQGHARILTVCNPDSHLLTNAGQLLQPPLRGKKLRNGHRIVAPCHFRRVKDDDMPRQSMAHRQLAQPSTNREKVNCRRKRGNEIIATCAAELTTCGSLALRRRSAGT